MSRTSLIFVLALGFLFLAACATGANSQSARPTLDVHAPTPTPEILPMPEQTQGKTVRPTLAPGQPTPTPEVLPPSGGQQPDPGMVQPLNTAPYALTLKDADDGDLQAEFYPAPAETKSALLLVSSSPQDSQSWQLLAQTAQVKGLAALVLELPQSGATPQATNAALQWLKAPENGGFEKIIVAGSEAGAGAALAALGQAPEVQAALLFSPPAGEAAFSGALQAASQPVLVVQSGDDPQAVSAGGSIQVESLPGSGRGVSLLETQSGLLEQVLTWCLGQLGS